MIRPNHKLVQALGRENSGRKSDFYTYMTEDVGFFGDPFIAFRRNWFNGLFHNDGILFYLHNYLQRFYDILKVDNKLIKPVLSDLQMQSYLCVSVEPLV